jgi:membrane protein
MQSKPRKGPPFGRVLVKNLWRITKNVLVRISRHNLTLIAAGIAFYAMTAIFPMIAALVSIYGLFADPTKIEQQVAGLYGLLPAASLELLTDALHSFATKSQATLNTALIISVGVALWSARAGVLSLMTGLNVCNETIENRHLVVQQLVALALTLGTVLFAMVALTAVALMPAVIDILPVPDAHRSALGYGRWPLLAVMICFALAVLYRFGPDRQRPKWKWITWGAVIATLLWIIGSIGFSFYVSRFSSFDATYGSLAAPVVLLLWFWVSASVVLLGAEIDAELEHGGGLTVRPRPEGAP